MGSRAKRLVPVKYRDEGEGATRWTDGISSSISRPDSIRIRCIWPTDHTRWLYLPTSITLELSESVAVRTWGSTAIRLVP